MSNHKDKVESERIARVRAMTVDQLVDMLDSEEEDEREDLEEALRLVVSGAQWFYDAVDGVGVGYCAFKIASLATSGNVDTPTARRIAEYMAMLANVLLQMEGAGEWDFATLIALKKIRRSDPQFAEWEQASPKPNGGTVATPSQPAA